MSTTILILTMCFQIAFAQSNSASNTQQSDILPKKIRISNGEWPPWLGQKLPQHGLTSQLVVEAFKEMGIEVEYSFVPWSRAYKATEAGDFDASVVWTKSSERENSFLYSKSIVLQTEAKFFYIQGTQFDWTEVSDLKKYTMGVTQSYFYGAEFDKALKNNEFKVVTNTSDEINLKMLFNKRFQIFPISTIVGLEMVNKLFPKKHEQSQFLIHPKPIQIEYFHLIVSKKSKYANEWIQKFDLGFEKLQRRGRVQEVYEQAFKKYASGY